MGALKNRPGEGGELRQPGFVYLKLDLEAVFYGLCASGCSGGIRELVQDVLVRCGGCYGVRRRKIIGSRIEEKREEERRGVILCQLCC